MKLQFTILAFLFTTICFAQSTNIRYYNNQYLEKEVNSSKAKYSETKTINPDGSITTNKTNLKNNKIEDSYTYKGIEPFGKWYNSARYGSKVIDYDFNLEYSKDSCINSIILNNYFIDSSEINYEAPKLDNSEKIFSLK